MSRRSTSANSSIETFITAESHPPTELLNPSGAMDSGKISNSSLLFAFSDGIVSKRDSKASSSSVLLKSSTPHESITLYNQISDAERDPMTASMEGPGHYFLYGGPHDRGILADLHRSEDHPPLQYAAVSDYRWRQYKDIIAMIRPATHFRSYTEKIEDQMAGLVTWISSETVIEKLRKKATRMNLFKEILVTAELEDGKKVKARSYLFVLKKDEMRFLDGLDFDESDDDGREDDHDDDREKDRLTS